MNTLNIEFSTLKTRENNYKNYCKQNIECRIYKNTFEHVYHIQYMYVKYGSLGITMSAYAFGKFSDSLELRIKWSFPNSNLDEYQVRYEIGNPNIDKFRVAESLNVHVQLIPRATSPSWRWS